MGGKSSVWQGKAADPSRDGRFCRRALPSDGEDWTTQASDSYASAGQGFPFPFPFSKSKSLFHCLCLYCFVVYWQFEYENWLAAQMDIRPPERWKEITFFNMEKIKSYYNGDKYREAWDVDKWIQEVHSSD